MTMPVSVKKKDGGKIGGPAAIPSVLEAKVFIQLPNTKVTTFSVHSFYAGAAPALQPAANTLYSSISSAWSSNLGIYMHTSTLFQGLWLRDMTVITNPWIVATGAAVAGTGTGAAMPPGSAIVLTENVNARGRGAKGRIYLGGWVSSTDVTTGGISTTVQTVLNAFGTAIVNALNAIPGQACVAQPHRQQYQGITGTIHPDRPANHVAVNNITCRDLIWDSQRRRAQL